MEFARIVGSGYTGNGYLVDNGEGGDKGLSFVRRERTAANDGAQLNEIGTKEKERGANCSN